MRFVKNALFAVAIALMASFPVRNASAHVPDARIAGSMDTTVIEMSIATLPRTKVRVSVTIAPDSTLRVVSTWGYKVIPSTGLPDSTRIKVGLGTAPVTGSVPVNKFVKWTAGALMSADTSAVPLAIYGQITGYVCVVPHRRNVWGNQTCANWTFVRPDAVVPPFDTVTAKVASGGVTSPVVTGFVIKPAGRQVEPDAGSACKNWLASNPGLSPWITVNVKAVPPCTGKNGIPIVAQFCAFVTLSDGSKAKTTNSNELLATTTKQAEWNYCNQEFTSWLNTRNV